MALPDIPAGTRLFLDANILVYALLKIEPFADRCRDLLRRIARREILGYTAATVAADVVHRAMVTEAVTKYGLQSREAVSYLKAHPNVVKELQRYTTIPGEISRSRVHILDVTYREIHASRHFRSHYGMMTADSIVLAVMRRHKLIHLVTNDPDFKRVPHITVWSP